MPNSTSYLTFTTLEVPHAQRPVFNFFSRTNPETALGGCAYYGPWRKYVAYFRDETIVMDATCLREVATFLDHINSGAASP